MALKIIGAGFGRTGTKSLKLALEQLGFGPCHHMEEVMTDPAQLPHWQAAVAGEPVDWDAAFAGYNSAVDWPAAHFWRPIADHFEDAKVILTLRDASTWWESFARTIMAALSKPLAEISDPHFLAINKMVLVMLGTQAFGSTFDDKDAAIAAYGKHVEDVKAAFPAERLLQLDITDGWQPLCAFLDVAVPDAPFPRANSSREFWDDDIREALK
jgi:hypothetical protein